MERIDRIKIDPTLDSKYLAQYNKEDQKAVSKRARLFGFCEIADIEQARQEENGKDKTARIERGYEQLKNLWFALFSNTPTEAAKFFDDILDSEDTMLRLVRFLQDSGIVFHENITPTTLSKVFISNPDLCNILPSDFLEQLTKAHVVKYEARVQVFEQNELPALLQRVNEKFNQAIKTGILPIDLSTWERFRDSTAIGIIDPIFENEAVQGDYAEKKGIQISLLLSQEQLEAVLIHEFLHVISGRTVIKETEEYVEEAGVESYTYFDVQRSGLHFTSSLSRKERFSWLNEAVTEDLTLKIRGSEKGSTYFGERKLLHLLKQYLGGEIETVIYGAYFENVIPGINKGEDFKTLLKKINEQFGNHFLIQLDIFIHEQRDNDGSLLTWEAGVDRAVAKWTKLGSSFPSFLNAWVQEQNLKFKLPARNMIDMVKQTVPKFLDNLSMSSLGDNFESVWQINFGSLIKHLPQYEVAVIKDLVRNMLKREILKKKSNRIYNK